MERIEHDGMETVMQKDCMLVAAFACMSPPHTTPHPAIFLLDAFFKPVFVQLCDLRTVASPLWGFAYNLLSNGLFR